MSGVYPKPSPIWRRYFRQIIVIAALGLGLAVPCSAHATDVAVKGNKADIPKKIVSIGGSVTETVFALGMGDRVVARDSTSTFPDEVNTLPNVGYIRALSAEGVLSFAPDFILSEAGARPIEVVELLRSASIPFVEIPDVYSREGVLDKIRAVGDALGVPEKAEVLAAEVDAKLESALLQARKHQGKEKRVLFVLSIKGGRILAAGQDTSADALIAMAGAENAVEGINGWKLLSDEAVTAAAPDVIVMMQRGGGHRATNAELFALPALATSPAAEADAVLRVDGLLMLGFGPRTADAVVELSSKLYGQ